MNSFKVNTTKYRDLMQKLDTHILGFSSHSLKYGMGSFTCHEGSFTKIISSYDDAGALKSNFENKTLLDLNNVIGAVISEFEEMDRKIMRDLEMGIEGNYSKDAKHPTVTIPTGGGGNYHDR